MADENMGYDPVAADIVTGFLTEKTIAGHDISGIPEAERRQISTVLAIAGMGLPFEGIDAEVLSNTVNEGYKVAADIEKIRGLPE